jgi:hypothetical protein
MSSTFLVGLDEVFALLFIVLLGFPGIVKLRLWCWWLYNQKEEELS